MAKFLMRLDPNLAILLIEHDMDVVFDVAEQISVLHFGEILETGTPEQIHASERVQEIYLGTGLKPWPILEVQDIHTYYGDAYVLQGLSLQLEQGQILGLLGRNGVGKTTLVNSIVGFNPPRRGKVVFKGDDITHGLVRNRAQRHGTGAARPPRVSDARRGRKSAGGRAQPRPPRLELAARLQVVSAAEERRNQRAKTLSGGEQQMLAIGRALMTNPDCLIMDEPSEGLAPIIIQGLWEAIGKLKNRAFPFCWSSRTRTSRSSLSIMCTS